MIPPYEFRTERLLIRKIKEEDAESISSSFDQNQAVTKYLSWKPRTNIEQTHEFVHRCVEEWGDEIEFTWVICFPEGRIIGLINLIIYESRATTGFVLEEKSWNKGFATEALQAIVKWAIDQPEIFRIWAYCDVENKASARVLEKVGMKREGILYRWRIHPNLGAIPRDCYSYACYK